MDELVKMLVEIAERETIFEKMDRLNDHQVENHCGGMTDSMVLGVEAGETYTARRVLNTMEVKYVAR